MKKSLVKDKLDYLVQRQLTCLQINGFGFEGNEFFAGFEWELLKGDKDAN